MDKKNIEQLLLKKEKIIQYNKKLASKKISSFNKSKPSAINKIPKVKIKPAKKSIIIFIRITGHFRHLLMYR